MRSKRFNGMVVQPGQYPSSFLSCEKDMEAIVQKLFVDDPTYSTLLKALLCVNTNDIIHHIVVIARGKRKKNRLRRFFFQSSSLPRAWSTSSAVRVMRSSRVTESILARRLFCATRMCSKMLRTPRPLPKLPSALSSAI